MNSEEINAILGMIKKLQDEKGITSVLVEHNMKAVTGICDRVAVLDYGKKIAEGSPREVIENRSVIEAYLGVEEDAI
jgi:branched-chain amino acid transport system ATP-binding protein